MDLYNDCAYQVAWIWGNPRSPLGSLQGLPPWFGQWHNEHIAEWGGAPAKDIAGFIAVQRNKWSVA